MLDFRSKLEQTRKKLLDLTKRNKLINYKRPSKTRNLRIIDESAEFIYQHLVFNEKAFKFKFIPEPEPLELENKKLLEKKLKLENVKQSTMFEGEKKAAEHQIQGIFEQLKENKQDVSLTAEEYAVKLGFITKLELPFINLESKNVDNKYTDDYLQTLHYPSDLEKILKKIELNSKSITQETGANMLYLILGVLEWKESNNSEITIKSPLINIPVALKRGSLNKKTNTYEYTLKYDGSLIDTNKSLSEKLKNDFNILLPELTEELSFNEYMTEVKKICINRKEWKIKQEISLDFLQFSKILMYKDLDTDNWNNETLENNTVLQDIFLGEKTSGESYAPEEYDIDNNKTALKIPLIMDADSSQHSAIVDVIDGKNVVIEGPPGTGKSQTITNMVAALIADGKSVLFVSEKLAALDVVYKRLESNQLGDFCLELHSHKTQKLKVLESLKTRIENNYPLPTKIERVKQDIIEKKKVLKKYIDILHLKYGNVDKKIFEIFWLVEKYQKISKYLKLDINNPEKLSIVDVNNCVEILNTYQSYSNNYNFNLFYWNGFEPYNLQFINIDKFIHELNKLNLEYKKLTSVYNKLNLEIDNEIIETIEITKIVLELKNIGHINQEMLNIIENHEQLFSNYINTFITLQECINKNETQIIGYNNLSIDEKIFLMDINSKDNKYYIELMNSKKSNYQYNIDNIIDYERLTSEEKIFLINLEDSGNINNIELFYEQERLHQYNIDNIINYKDLSNDEKMFLINLTDQKLKQIDIYINSQKQYNIVKTELNKYIDIELIKNDDEDIISEKLMSINEFLYTDITLSELNSLYKLNEDISTVLSMLERNLVDMSDFTGVINSTELRDIENINLGLNLLSKIDKNLYINSISSIGTFKYISVIRDAKEEITKINNLTLEIESIFNIDKISKKEVSFFIEMRRKLIDKKDSFFKIFSSEFKKTKIEYNNLLINDLDKDSNIWINKLDKLISYLQTIEEYENNIVYKNEFKNLFQGLSTNWDQIHQLHEWGEKVRHDIKSKVFIRNLLSGEEQIFISLSSCQLNDNLEELNRLIILLENKYNENFIRKLYRRVIEIDIIDLKQEIDNLNEKLIEYISSISKLNINSNIEIITIIQSINQYNKCKKLFIDSKYDVETMISNSIQNKFDSSIINQFLVNMIIILEKQILPITKVSSQLILERKIDQEIELLDDELKENIIQTINILRKQKLSISEISNNLKLEKILDEKIELLDDKLKETILSTIEINKKQDLDSDIISTLLKNEEKSHLSLQIIIDNIEKNTGYKVLQKNEEINSLKEHMKLINIVNRSKIIHPLKKLILKDYFLIYKLLEDVYLSYTDIVDINNNLKEFGNIVENKFYENINKKYLYFTKKLDKLNDNINNLSIWIDYQNIIKNITKLGLIKIIDAVNSKQLPKEMIVDSYYYSFYNSLLRSSFKKYSSLNQFSRLTHEEVIIAFKELDLQLLELNKELVAAKASNRIMPDSKSGGLVSSFTNMRLIENEISKKKRHIPIRKLIERAGKAIQALKPCFMMSPLSVAQYLPPNKLEFDVLLVDEASQLRPEEALGIIARAKQVVIVGDPKQLPPTSFFDTIKDDNDNDEDTILDVSESILDSCINLYNPIRRLKWHYRSQHETLIDFSNQQFYDNNLIVFPSPTSISSNELGVKHTYIKNAIYQGGAGKRYNKIEAKILVEHIEKQIKEFPEKSLGIGTFNTAQRDLIQHMIDEKEKINPLLANYISKWIDTSEPFFIKNLESLQGDERDVIFISTTYGPDQNTGKLMQRFGPINQDSGWRRLNVLVTRSKQKMHVFTSIQSSEILVNENSSKGVIAFKSFISFLETGILFNKPTLINGKGFDSPFEESVYQLLSDVGIKSVPQVGVAGYFIDLAVVSNEGEDYTLAIECDGATYHSSKSARDRDRLKDEVLNRLGWKVYRIWSVDWYKNRQNEIRKLLTIIREEQEKYSERYKHRTVNCAPSQIVDNNIEDDLIEKESSEVIVKKSEHTKIFSSNELIKELLIELRDNEISKEYQIDRRCVLSPLMIDQFLKYKPVNREEFQSKISLRIRQSIDPDQMVFIDDIFEILEMSE